MTGEARRRLIGAACLLAVLPALSPLIGPLLQNGDSAVYNDQVDRLALAERATHIGYIALGVVFRALLPGSTDVVMNAMTVVLGVAGLLGVYFTAHRIGQSVTGSLLAAAALLSVPAYLRGMLLSEVDVPLAACSALALSLWISARPIAAGLAYGLALLISPLAALVLPAFVIVPPLSATGAALRPGPVPEWKPLAAFALAGLAVYAPVVLANRQSYVYGGRGLLGAPRLPFAFAEQASRSWRFIQHELWPIAPVLVLGLVVALQRKQRALVAGLLACVLTSLFGERFGASVPVQLTAIALLLPCIALAVTVGPAGLRYAVTGAALVAIVWNGASSLQQVRVEMAELARTRATLLAIRDASPLPPTVVGVNGFSAARRAERWLTGSTKNGLVLSRHSFVAQCAELAREPGERAFWLLARSIKRPCRELMQRYDLRKLDAGGVRYRVLLPTRLP